MYGRVRVHGHPLHPMLVLFPIAFYTTTLVAYVVAMAFGSRPWFQLGVVSNVIGIVAAIGAGIVGFVDWVGLPSEHPGKAIGAEHMLLNLAALTVFALDAYLQVDQWNTPRPAHFTDVTLAVIAFGFAVSAGLLGWTMVRRYIVHDEARRDHSPKDPDPSSRRPHPSVRGL